MGPFSPKTNHGTWRRTVSRPRAEMLAKSRSVMKVSRCFASMEA